MWDGIFEHIENIKTNIVKKDNASMLVAKAELQHLGSYLVQIPELHEAYVNLMVNYGAFANSGKQEDLDLTLSSLEELKTLCEEVQRNRGNQDDSYEQKVAKLNILIQDLEDIKTRATANNLFSEWHRELLSAAENLYAEIQEIGTREGKEVPTVDLSRFVFAPGEFTIDDLTKAYQYYLTAKSTYDGEVLPDYEEIMKKYDRGEVSEAVYNAEADKVLRYCDALKKARIELMENIRTATIGDYINKPQHEVDEYLASLNAYNAKLKVYEKLYKDWEAIKTSDADPLEIATLYQQITTMAAELSEQRPGLVKQRGLIYNSKTLSDLKKQKNMIEEIIKDATATNDKDFETKRAEYEEKLKEINSLIKKIEDFKKSLAIKKIKPLEPVVTVKRTGVFRLAIHLRGNTEAIEGELVKIFGEGAKIDEFDLEIISQTEEWIEYKATRKTKKRKPKTNEEENKDYEFDAIDEPVGFGPEDVIEQPKNRYYNLEELIAKITYGDPPDHSIKYGKLDNFVYLNKDIKLINFPKSHGITILDKPMKLFKTGIAAVIKGLGKACAKLAFKNKTRRETIDGLLRRIEELTPEEIEFLATNFTANRMTELSKAIPEVAMSALNNRIAMYYSAKLDVINQKIYELYDAIITKYNRYKEIEQLLSSGNLSEEEVQALNAEKASLDDGLCKDLMNLQEQQRFAADLNKGGAMSFSENWRVRHNSSAGGRNISKKFMEDAIKPYNFTRIADNVRDGNGYLAAKDFLYGEKVKIAGTKTAHKARNWFHKTRVGAYEFKPFVEIVDYSKDTYLQDVLSTIALVASIANMVYVSHLKAQLAAAQEKIAALDQTIEAQNQQIKLLTQQVNTYNKYIGQVNVDIQANNQAIEELKNICALYNSDPEKFVEKMADFAMHENGKTHTATEYVMQHTDAGRWGTTRISSDGPFYATYDAQGHLFSKDIVDKITSISNNPTLTAQQKATQIGNVLRGMNDNLISTVAAGKADIVRGLALPGSSQWSFEQFEYLINNIATSDASFVPNVFESFINAAIKVESLKTINDVLPITITSISEIPQIALTLPTVDLIPAIAALSSLIGKEAAEAIAESYRNPSKKQKGSQWEEKTAELSDRIKNVEMDLEKEAKRIYEEHMEEWKKKGPFYRMSHRKEKPTMEQAYVEAKAQEGQGRGM